MTKVFRILNFPGNRKELRSATLHALPVTVLVLSLFYYWFAIADRYAVFLYYHDMGRFVPDTSPFSAVTSSRYWMAGLVAGGMVTVFYTGGSWLLGRLVRDYRPPAWWCVWAASGVPIAIGVPLITLTVNEPTLPVLNAVQTTLCTVLSVGLAVAPGKVAAERPWDLVLLSLDGWAMAGLILSLALLERAVWTLSRGVTWPLVIVGVGAAGAVVLLSAMTGVRVRRRMTAPTAPAVFVAGLSVAYLLLPLVHHIGFSDGHYYISDRDNFFSRDWGLQIVAWLVAAAIAIGITWLRGRLTGQDGAGSLTVSESRTNETR